MDNVNFIKSVTVERFKCFDSFTIDGLKRVNLISGKNNIGKTAFMEVCYLAQSTQNSRDFFHSLLVLELSRNPLVEFEILEDSNSFDFKFEDTKIVINKIPKYIDIFSKDNLYTKPEKDYNRGIKEITQFYNGKNRALNLKNKQFISMNTIRAKFMAECIDEIKLQDNEDALNAILKELFNIKKIDVIKNQVMVKKEKDFILLNEFGDGIKHLLNIVLALYLNNKSTIYLDEVDNGIHYSLFDSLWEIIFKLSKENSVQVFATTHSKECIESYNRVSTKVKDDDITYIKMTKDKNGVIKAVLRDNKLLKNSLEQHRELRG